MTFSTSRRRTDFAEPYVLTVATSRTPDDLSPLPEPPPPRPGTCPHCGERDPVDLLCDAVDGSWSWACAICLAEVEKVDAAPRSWEPSDEEWDEEADAPRTIRPVTRQQERTIVRLAKKDVPTATIATKVRLSPWTVRKVRARHGLSPAPARAKPVRRMYGATVRCKGCSLWLPYEMRDGRRVLLDGEIVDAHTRARKRHKCAGRPVR